MANDQEKQAAAIASLDFVHEGDIVGLGSGSTSEYFIRALAERVHAGLKIVGIPSSFRTRDLAAELLIPLTSLDEHQVIDVAIDGADEIDPKLRLIKGGGGSMLREKVVASVARQFVIIADSSKEVKVLGDFPLPEEVIPFAQAVAAKKIREMGASVMIRQIHFGNPFVTDEGHQILDCHFGEIKDPERVARELDLIPGVVGHGLFLDMANVALIGKGGKVEERRRDKTRGAKT